MLGHGGAGLVSCLSASLGCLGCSGQGWSFAWGWVVLLEARAVHLVPTASFFRSATFSADAGRVRIRVQAAVCWSPGTNSPPAPQGNSREAPEQVGGCLEAAALSEV